MLMNNAQQCIMNKDQSQKLTTMCPGELKKENNLLLMVKSQANIACQQYIHFAIMKTISHLIVCFLKLPHVLKPYNNILLKL